VGAGADDERALAARQQDAAQGAGVAGQGGLRESVVSPSSSAALPQPLPSVRAMSWRSTPVFSAIWAAALRAISKGSVAGSSRG
jgi:hypothetical protein